MTFTADLSCEPAAIDPNLRFDCFELGPWCDIVNFTMVAHNEDCHMSGFYNWSSGLTGWIGGVTSGTCDNEANDLDRERVVVFSAYKDVGPVLVNSTAFFCRPSFRIQQSTVTIDQSGSLKSVGHSTSLNIPNDLTSLAIFEAVKSTVNQVDPRRLTGGLITGRGTMTLIDSFFQLIAEFSGSQIVDDLLVGDMMARGAQKIFKGVAVQLAKRYLLTPTSIVSSAEFEGTAECKQQRLFLRSFFLRLMESVLCALIIVCMYLALRPRHHTTPQDPASIARLSSAISRSRHFNFTMSSTGSISSKSLKGLLPGKYGAVFLRNAHGIDDKALQFVVKSHEADIPKLIPLNTKFWQPSSMSWYFRLALFVVPLALIVALEITLRQSQRNDGLLDVTTNKWTHYGSAFVPALGE
jgi:hypothetical protein